MKRIARKYHPVQTDRATFTMGSVPNCGLPFMVRIYFATPPYFFVAAGSYLIRVEAAIKSRMPFGGQVGMDGP